jgi:signal recognition particle subunit SEC65
VREYLERRRDYTEIERHTLAVERCVETYISELQSQPKSTSEQHDVFRPYATVYWPVHCQAIGSDQLEVRLKDKVKRFLLQGCNAAPSFAKWTSTAMGLSRSSKLNHPQREILRAASNASTPLSWAARNGHSEIVKLLLEKDGIDVNSMDNYGRTPLSRAAENGHLDVVKLLLDKDSVDVDSKDSGRRTPLSWAVQNRHSEIVKLLLEKDGIKINFVDRDNQTPFTWAVERGYLDIVKLLLEKEGVNIDSKDSKYSRKPLSWAARNGHSKVVKLLLE